MALSHRIRIIGGVWRSRQIQVLDQQDLRPSSDRVRETLFNWLGPDLSGLKAIDVFAGSGALGFEAASRSVDAVVLIENDKRTYNQLLRQYQLLNSYPICGEVKILHGDGIAYLQDAIDQSVQLIFLDPPFSQPELLIRAVHEAGRVCHDQGRGGIYIECPNAFDLTKLEGLLPNWTPIKSMETAQVKAVLFRRSSS
ncbi:16S rRNA (guanine(966)-N(2))-methyltransferase RsmD [Polynucleobacter sp. HIN5]|uniref:16S rRNA (guanine(966)-N(2))-methyltransferase RsmD n=1 Tax=Polynucleobacter sp. HIN5 TaxID=3047864 RepID=UPI002572878E|nr:16S rRNA (guanine(966)-N(2))-methyltransferase RsmD [Polynucleobacter sp. HIN5]BEI34354.1 16S rRNA (guanine(966)-N(2))-methyltransferase RsmD [Polynucleobacter sp. HIN5]